MILIIEGIDGSGKSTLATKLGEQNKYEIIHRSLPRDQKDKDEMLQMYIDIVQQRRNIIFDRCWYSEMAYGPVMRDDSVITYPQMYQLERMVAKQGGMIIYCTGPKSVLWKRATQRGEEYVTSREDFDGIYDGYETIMSVPHLVPVVTYSIPNA